MRDIRECQCAHLGVPGIKIRDGGIRGNWVPASDIRESGPTGYPGYLKDIRDITEESGSGMGGTILVASGSLPDLPDSTS